MERTVPQGCRRVLIVGEPETPGQHRGRGCFKAQHQLRHPQQHAPDVAQVQRVCLGLRHQLPAQADAFANQQRQECGQGHDAEAAHLNQPQDYGLPERRPVRCRVHGDQPGDAHCRDGREQRVHEDFGVVSCPGQRQHQ